jgi:hypothetical protein
MELYLYIATPAALGRQLWEILRLWGLFNMKAGDFLNKNTSPTFPQLETTGLFQKKAVPLKNLSTEYGKKRKMPKIRW